MRKFHEKIYQLNFIYKQKIYYQVLNSFSSEILHPFAD